MNKKELLENYTMEQLADMVVKLQDKKDSESKSFKAPFSKMSDKELEKFLSESPIKKSVDNFFENIQQQKDNVIAIEFTKQIGQLLRDNGVIAHYTETETAGDNKLRYGVLFDSLDFSEHDRKFTENIEKLKTQINRKQEEIRQIDDILNELFGVTHDVVNKPDEFKKILKEKIENSKTIADLLPTEPIEAATELINASYTRNKGELEKKIDKAFGNTSDTTIEQMYSIPELRQIAEHLLVYCNAKGEGEE